MRIFFILLTFLELSYLPLRGEENFILINDSTNEIIKEFGPSLEMSLEVVLGHEAKEIDSYLSSIAGETSFHGAVMIKKGGKILLSKGYGYARQAGTDEIALPNTATTLFHIGSITKQFTAAALMKLAEVGKITIDGKINDYLPNEYQSTLWNNVTIKQLLTHTSGLGNYLADPNYLKKSQDPHFNVDSIIKEAMQQKTLTYPVGEFHYSNTGYLLLGAIIEKVSHQSYGQFMREFFDKAGMYETDVHDDTFEESPRIAHGYRIDASGKKLEEDLSEDLARTCGADGNMYSSLNDLARWSDILDSRSDIISSESLKEMMTPVEKGYGYGIKIEKSFERTKISHNGNVPGFISSFYKFPQEGMGEDLLIVVLGNNGCFPSDFIAQYITEFFLLGSQGEYPKPVLNHNFSGDSCIGIFKSMKHGTQFKLIEQEGHLFIYGLDGLERLLECYLLSNQRLYVPGRSTQLEYKDNEITVYKEGKAIDHLMRVINF